MASSTARPVFVVTGTSGEGKSTLAKLLVERVPELALAVSATTRPRRPGEEDGRDYWFLSDREFEERLAAGASDVAVGTALFGDPGAAQRVRSELEAELAAFGFANPDNAIGVASAPTGPTLDPRSRLQAKKSLHTRLNLAG